MSRNAAKIAQRREDILQQLEQETIVSIQDLAWQQGVTTVTIRSDLEVLEREGHLRRIPGGAVAVVQTPLDPPAEISLLEEKRTIARSILDQIEDGATLFLNSGTTTLVLARMLKQYKQNLNVVTNSVEVAMELGNASTFRVILLGGEINARYGFTYGTLTAEQLIRYRADWAVLALDGVDCQGGLTTYHPEEAMINSTMIAGSKQVIIAADHTKIGRTGFTHFADVGPNMLLATANPVQETALEVLRDKGVQIIIS